MSEQTSPDQSVRDPARLAALRETGLLDSDAEEVFDRMTRLAVKLLGIPAAFISLVDEERDFFKSAFGFGEQLASERQLTGRTFCHYTIASDQPLIISDTQADPVFSQVPTVESLGVAAYVGVPLVGPDGHRLGSFCAIDFVPRQWTDTEIETLSELAASARREIELRAYVLQLENQTIRLQETGTELSIQVQKNRALADALERDVAGLSQAEAALRESERILEAQHAELRQMIDVIPHYLFVKDDEGRYVVANQAFAAAYGTTADGIVGKRDTDLGVPVPEAERYHEEELEVIRTGFPRYLSAERWQMNGEPRLYETLKVPFHRAGTDRPAVLGLVRDTTEEQRQAQQLRRAERLASVGTLVGGVAHELNNPLTAIKGFTSLMLMDVRSEEDREGLETVLREADRMARIVADLRRVARETQDQDAPPVPVDVNEVIRHVLKIRRYELSTHNIEVVEELQPDLGQVMADRGRLEQVVLNLVVNAEQAMASATGHGTLTLSTQSGPRAVSLCVEDTGPGVAPEHQERIFDPFWSTKAPGEGTGLGLSLVHGIVQDLGGDIRVESEPGMGTRFTIVLPRAPGAAITPPEGVAAAPARDPAPPPPLRVLVVDDEAAIRTTLSRYLKRHGHHVDEAAEGEAALQQLAKAREAGVRYDAIISDLRMPGLDGGHLLQQLREEGDGMEDHLIFLTGDSASHEAEALLQGACVPVVLKPFDFSRLEVLIERVASGRAHSDEANRASGERLHTHAGHIRRAFVARLRSDPVMPATSHLADAVLEDHVCVLIADLAQMLIIPAASLLEGDAMMEDSAAIRHVTSSLHGAQRSRLGWSDRHLVREFEILHDEVIRALSPRHPAVGTSLHDATRRTVESFFTSVREISLAAIRRARASDSDRQNAEVPR